MKRSLSSGFTPTPIGRSLLETGSGATWSTRCSTSSAVRRRQLVKGFTLVEVMIVVAIIALLAAIAIPNVLRGRTTAGESSAIGTVHSLVAGLEMYRAVNNQYPADWVVDMYTNAEPDYGPLGFAGAATGPGTVQGYTYTYTQVTAQTYTLTALPATPGTTGSRSFFVDASGRVRHCRCAGTTCAVAAVGSVTIEAVPGVCA